MNGFGEEEKEENKPTKMEQIINKIVAATKTKYQAEILGNLDMSTLLLEIRDHITQRSWLAAQKWCRWEQDKFVLFPDHTRLYYRKGQREVTLQEYSPQVRVMSFKERLAQPDSVAATKTKGGKTLTYALAVPYMEFIFMFDGGKFSNVYVAFSDRPLKDLHEPILRPYLPNLDDKLRLCLGRDMDYTKLVQGNITQQVAYVLSHFWQTVYTDEWSVHYWENKSHFTKTDKRLKSLEAWQKASIDNPLFVVEDVKWLKTGENFGTLVSRLFDSETIDTKFGQEIYTPIYEKFQELVEQQIRDKIKTADAKLGPSLQQSLMEELQQLLENA